MAGLSDSSALHVHGQRFGEQRLDGGELAVVGDELVAADDEPLEDAIAAGDLCQLLFAAEAGGHTLYLTGLLSRDADVVVSRLCADDNVHHIQLVIDSSGTTCRDDAVGGVAADERRRADGGIHFAYAALQQDQCIRAECADDKLEVAVVLRLRSFEQTDQLVVLLAHRR